MKQSLTTLNAVSPLDGRYAANTESLRQIFSEFALIKFRVFVEVKWFLFLSEHTQISELPKLSNESTLLLNSIIENFTEAEAQEIRNIEKITNHDVKAVEYYLRNKINDHSELSNYAEFWHFACTSEDINNLSYALMLKEGVALVNKEINVLLKSLAQKANDFASVAMLSHTHGQSASPTTVGKEFANIGFRLYRQVQQLNSQSILGKINGAVGNYNAHIVAYPSVDWQQLSSDFINDLGLEVNPLTTQIEPHDYCAELAHIMIRINSIILDASRDCWLYISKGYFKQKLKEGEVGSSTMPHKVNPIDFENAEGNVGLSNVLLTHMAEKLPISRLQRDLTDSTVQRNWGVALGYHCLAVKSFLKGLAKVDINYEVLESSLKNSPEVLTEAVQTVMRKHSIANAYEFMKQASRGQKLDLESLTEMIKCLEISEEEKNQLLKLKPESYIGNAELQARDFYQLIENYLR